MPKLTEEQKDANKAARKVKQKEFSRRMADFKAAEAAMKDALEGSPVAIAAADAHNAWNSVIDRRTEERAALKQRMEELRAEETRLNEAFELSMKPVVEARRATSQAKEDESRAAKAKLYERFPDMYNVWSAGGWNPALVPTTAG